MSYWVTIKLPAHCPQAPKGLPPVHTQWPLRGVTEPPQKLRPNQLPQGLPCGSARLHAQLNLRVCLRFLSLIFDMSLYCLFVPVSAYRSNIIPASPEFSSPQLPLPWIVWDTGVPLGSFFAAQQRVPYCLKIKSNPNGVCLKQKI
jgi:hypothetical protein